MVVKLKRTIAIMLAFCFLVSITAAAVSAQQVDMAQRIVTGGTTATSTDGKGTVARIFLPAHTFKPGTWVHIVPIGWDYTFTYGDHPILKQSLWLVQPRYDSPDWQRVTWATARSDGSVLAGYSVEFGSENQDNPFTVNINYAAFGVWE